MSIQALNPSAGIVSKNSFSREMTHEQKELLKRTVAGDQKLTDDEFALFMTTCEHLQLDPFLKQVYIVKRGKDDKAKATIQIGIDGYRIIADRTRKYMPGKAPTFTYDKNGKLFSATAYVKKLAPDGTWHEIEATAMYDEYMQGYDSKPNSMWQKMPHGQLSKCAESLALRRAFPSEMGSLRTTEEMGQAMPIVDEATGEIQEVKAEVVETSITMQQAFELESLIGDDDELRASVYKFYKVDGFQDLPASRFEKCHSALKARAEARLKKEMEMTAAAVNN